MAVFARRRRVWIVAGGRRACFSRVYHRSAKSPEIAPRRECGEFLALLRSADLIGSHNRRLRSLRSLTSGYLPCTPPACVKKCQTPARRLRLTTARRNDLMLWRRETVPERSEWGTFQGAHSLRSGTVSLRSFQIVLTFFTRGGMAPKRAHRYFTPSWAAK